MTQSVATWTSAEEHYQGENFCFARLKGLFLILHTVHPPSDREWGEYVQSVERATRRGHEFVTLVFTDLSREERKTFERLLHELHGAGFARQVETWRRAIGSL